MRRSMLASGLISVPLAFSASLASSQGADVLTGTAAFAGWKTDAPGVRRLIKETDLPAPPVAAGADLNPEASVGSPAKVVAPPQGALPKVPDGFVVQRFASGFK